MEKNGKFQCDLLSSNLFRTRFDCHRLLKTSEELIFNKKHNSNYDNHHKWICPEHEATSYCHCIDELKKTINNPILFQSYTCNYNSDSTFLSDYHDTHTCGITSYHKNCCLEFNDTGKCDSLKKVEEKIQKWNEDHKLPFDKELSGKPVN